ncbi:26S protease regulatory subunit 6B like [Apostasia shenzhenica]|uniref:26S protease regulatory subunit 6B like n=1 Tax=Apostasia shenzhenica TaxID=1088818 RepID=A0A2H9ZTB1_9ASPA|nr:26S protease regulatory subunit 6B like [Apostasia shenzhenica]
MMPSLTSAAASIAGGLLLIRTILSHQSLLYLLALCWRWAEERTQAYQSFTIPRQGDGSPENPLYRKAAAYISSLPSLEDSDHTDLFSSGVRHNEFSAQLAAGQTVHDSFLGARLSWTLLPSGAGLALRLRRQDRYRVLRPYLQHVETVAEEIELRKKDIRLYTNAAADGDRGHLRWRSAAFTHPATLDTLAMEQDLKNRVRADLESFLKGRAYYARLGRVWKRSYLLYGPPGTGKSSFVAAMARLLCFDVYDLDLSQVPNGGDLRSLLLDTTPRSLILVEDLDRYLAADGASSSDHAARLTAMLNFMDGVFSCCGEERVMVFTATGGKDALDPAVLRPGRLDVHIQFPLCNFSFFKSMAGSYLGIKDHKLYPQVEEGFQSGAVISPAEVGEIMIAHRTSPSRALKSVISALQRSASAGAGGRGEAEEAAQISLRRNGSVKEFRKLYGLIRMRNGSKREGTLTVDIAAAAAADGGGGVNYSDQVIS